MAISHQLFRRNVAYTTSRTAHTQGTLAGVVPKLFVVSTPMREIELPCKSGTVPTVIEYSVAAPFTITRQTQTSLCLSGQSQRHALWVRGIKAAAVVNPLQLIDRW